jgi:hypothetical protein
MIAIAGNYSRDNQFRRTGWLCLCGEREEQEHILKHCQKYEDIRQKYEDFEDDDSLVRFFREVLERRDKVREEEQKEEKRRKQGAGEGEEE